MDVGYNELELELSGIKSYDEMISKVKEAVSKRPGEWIVGRGWHQDKWDVKPEVMVKGFPVHEISAKYRPTTLYFLIMPAVMLAWQTPKLWRLQV